MKTYHRFGKDGKIYRGKKGAGILFTNGQKILLLKRADGDEIGSWGIPGGKGEAGELDIDTAVRETKEECGGITGQRLGKFEEYDNVFRWTTFFYKVDRPFQCHLSKEHSEYKWVPLDEVESLPLHSKFKENWPDYKRAIKKRFSFMQFKEFFQEQQQQELWLDDERNPDDPLIQELFGARPGMIWVKTVPEAKKYLSEGNISFISLDHDLGQLESGYDLAKWIEEEAYFGRLPQFSWAVHSQNAKGKDNIVAAMKNADRFWAKG